MEKQTNGKVNKQTDKNTDTETERNNKDINLNAGLKLNLCGDQKKHVAGAVGERIHKETDKWKNRQINKGTDKETNINLT